MSEADRTCPSCGAHLQEATRFCPNCGARLTAPPAQPATDATILLPSPGQGAAPTQRLEPQGAEPPAEPATAPPAIEDIPTQRLEPPPPPPAAPIPPAPEGWAPPAPASPAPRRGLQVGLLIGGVGCLGLVLLLACAGLALISAQGFAGLEDIDSPPATSAQPSPISGSGGIIPGDSLITGGDVLLRDDFSDPDSGDLTVSEDESTRYAYAGGGYEIEVIEPDLIAWTMVSGSFADLVVECDTAVRPGSELAAAGIIFHYQDDQNFYLFRVSSDGYYALDLLEDDEWVTLIDWTESDAIDAVNNRLRVATSGDRIELFVNDELLEATEDGTFTRGEVGLASSSFEQGPATIRFDNLLITNNE